jgi:hypothetical protein
MFVSDSLYTYRQIAMAHQDTAARSSAETPMAGSQGGKATLLILSIGTIKLLKTLAVNQYIFNFQSFGS